MPDQPLRLVVAGRPNVGKSSLINRLLEDERLLTGPEPGLTRDAISGRLAVAGPQDRAGRHRRAAPPGADRAGRPGRAVEPLRARGAAPRRGRAPAARRDDAARPAGPDDRQPGGRGRPRARGRRQQVGSGGRARAPRWRCCASGSRPACPRSRACPACRSRCGPARTCPGVLPAVVEAHERWSRRVPTAALNRWLEQALAAHPPPMAKGRRVKIRYATQVATRPPTFVLFVSQAGALPGLLSALSGQRPARDLRSRRRAAPAAAAHRRQSVRLSGSGAQRRALRGLVQIVRHHEAQRRRRPAGLSPPPRHPTASRAARRAARSARRHTAPPGRPCG